jgi:hypothetical protein
VRGLAGAVAGDVAIRREDISIDATRTTNMRTDRFERVRRRIPVRCRVHAQQSQTQLITAGAAQLVQSILEWLEWTIVCLTRITRDLNDRLAKKVGKRHAAVIRAIGVLLAA